MQITVTYTEDLIRRAIFRFWRRFIGWRGVMAIVVCSVMCLWAVFWQTEAWVMYGCLALWVFLVCSAGGVYVAFLRRSLSKFRKMNDPIAEVTISADELRMKSDVADSKVQWRGIEAIWRFPETWLLFLGKNLFITLPIDPIRAVSF
jgi:YcxB-like protein